MARSAGLFPRLVGHSIRVGWALPLPRGNVGHPADSQVQKRPLLDVAPPHRPRPANDSQLYFDFCNFNCRLHKFKVMACLALLSLAAALAQASAACVVVASNLTVNGLGSWNNGVAGGLLTVGVGAPKLAWQVGFAGSTKSNDRPIDIIACLVHSSGRLALKCWTPLHPSPTELAETPAHLFRTRKCSPYSLYIRGLQVCRSPAAAASILYKSAAALPLPASRRGRAAQGACG